MGSTSSAMAFWRRSRPPSLRASLGFRQPSAGIVLRLRKRRPRDLVKGISYALRAFQARKLKNGEHQRAAPSAPSTKETRSSEKDKAMITPRSLNESHYTALPTGWKYYCAIAKMKNP